MGQIGLPGERDSTSYTGNNQPNVNLPIYSSIDIEGDWAFTSYATGLSVWDISGTKSEKPGRAATFDIRNGPGCVASGNYVETPDCSELKEFFWDVDAPPGNSNIVAMSGLQPVGLTIIDTTNKGNLKLLYQDTGRGSTSAGTQVYAATIGGRSYAFLGVDNGQVGLYLYDMTSASTLNRCAENTSAGTQCANVFKGRVGGANVVQYVDGVSTSSGKHYVATSAAVSDMGLRIWNVTNPTSASNVHNGGGKFLTTDVVFGVAMWEQASKQYLAIHIPGGGRIYDVTSCLANGCAALPAPVWTGQWLQYGTGPSGPDRSFVTFSRSGNRPMLYFGALDQCSGGRQREFIFDVTNAGSPTEVSSEATMVLEGKTLDYWSWYYSGNHSNNAPKHGFSRVTPMVAKFNGPNLYRAARTIFDVHVWAGGGSVPPVAAFTVGGPVGGIYVNDPVQFTDTSSGNPTSWNWTFQDGSPANSTAQNPSVTFTSPGVKTVTHTATNAAGTSNPGATQLVTVLDPAPKIGSVVTVPESGPYFTCNAVTFKADNITGKPLPGVSWVVLNGLGGQVAIGNGDTITVPAPGGTSSVTYTATATPVGGAPKDKTITINPPAALDFTDASNGPKNDPFAAGTVTFHALASGATNYNWDFGDGLGYRGYNTAFDKADPVFGYSSTGPKNVRVKIKNCGGELESTVLAITIQQIEPLVIQSFSADGCAFGFCQFGVGQSITFDVQVTGGPTSYQFAWDDGTTTTAAPVNGKVTKTYATAGTYTPKLTVVRGTEPPVAKEHPLIIVEGSVQPPPPPPTATITVSGPSSGDPEQALTFSASASNCSGTVNSTGWNWNPSGGTLTGSGASVSIKWTSTGTKTVSVTHPACGSAQGQKSVSIGSVPNNPGGLAANFTWSPANPAAGQSVTFDASSSSGSPSGFTWDFGGGVTKTGQTVTHTFGTSGPKTVQLEVVKQGNCALGLCTANTTKTVSVGGPTGPPPIVASFNTSAACIAEFGINVCTANSGEAVSFTDTSTGGSGAITTRNWDFGDGTKATGAAVSHTFKNGGSFVVTLTVGDGASSANTSRNFTVAGEPVAPISNTIVLPWIAQSRGVLNQSSDLYVHNPGATAMEIVLEFRKRGLPEINPPRATRTIQPGATLYVADVLKELFSWENIVGFVTITKVKGDRDPVMTSFNTTFGSNGSQFGQTVPGVVMSNAAAATAGSRVQYLVGLNDNSNREAYFGITNPNPEPATYRLKFFNSLGQPLGKPSGDLKLSSFGLKQFQPAEVRSLFGINTQDDYRVEVETVSGRQLYPYGANVRTTSDDPSYLGVGLSNKSKLYLLGAMSTPGINNTRWQSDVVLSNTGAQVALADVSFLKVGVGSQPTAPLKITLQPGQTDRLEDIVGSQWNIKDSVGVITVESNSPNGVFPIVQGESYETTNASPGMRFGQFMAAFTDEDAAGPGKGHYLVGLRQNADSRTTYWLFNPSNQSGNYDLIYRALNGTEIGRISNASLGAGKMRQISPSQHPLPPAGVAGGFTVQVVVKSGKVLSAGQVINNKTNDPAYVQGQVQ
ncbi:MAG TPA: PKD domain-containing protein [Thermoanaerobaculia bacterium]|nr:PKD domain-containing protein [Thermoanaerobaculia bacterium]